MTAVTVDAFRRHVLEIAILNIDMRGFATPHAYGAASAGFANMFCSIAIITNAHFRDKNRNLMLGVKQGDVLKK